MIINISEAQTEFPNLIEKYPAGEKIIIAGNGKPLFQFAPLDIENISRKSGFFNCDIDMSSFDDPIEEMKEYE
ncbi:MAG: hypothetical protein V2I97_17355 [Desulfococcaceae bacterium]|jgi:antitoxin (DNA-binding transcriptional repressor) of toxin-antitoxin stability system|nr:hypothetical protein [Desulfococcaceae bacterium]